MTYFRELPNIQYENFLSTSTGSQSYLTLKNIFLRGKVRTDLMGVYAFDKYEIAEDERPDQIARKIYGTSTYDWVVLISANILNYQDQYPLTSQLLYNYVINKYGQSGAYDTHHYESTEVRDSMDRLIYPAGLYVAEDFTIPNPDLIGGIIRPVTTITNFEYETRKNDAKKEINVIKRSYLNQFVTDMRQISN